MLCLILSYSSIFEISENYTTKHSSVSKWSHLKERGRSWLFAILSPQTETFLPLSLSPAANSLYLNGFPERMKEFAHILE